ncbi:MAG: hypothetical protein QOH51_3862 [Acidobacteriota bacterium]|nr:hypothetical protein [Acidobacteriota bacterium]
MSLCCDHTGWQLCGGFEDGMSKGRKSVKLMAEEEYTISEELTAEARRLASKITGRKVTGELVINLNQGGVSTVRVREVVKQTK